MPWPRIISALVAIVVASAMIVLGGWYFTLGFGAIVLSGDSLEIFELVHAKGILPAAKTTLVVSQILLVTAHVAPDLVDALLPLGGTFICFYLLFQPQVATMQMLPLLSWGCSTEAIYPAFGFVCEI
jgi:phosphatidate cytidylyltransferase